jgi:type II secretion system protein C
MKHPFWILNSTLLFLLTMVLLFIFFSRQRVPSRQSITVDEYFEPVKRDISQVSLEKIYENDLFNTYRKEFKPIEQPAALTPIPPPPIPQAAYIPEKPAAQFLDPLPITLKGVTIISGDDTKSRAIIEDNNTSTEKTYKVGDKIEDAQLLRIFSNKVVLIRSNGQQEVLYLREKDAQLDPAYALITGWDSVVQKINDTAYHINPASFAQRVPTLGQFIDLIDIITVYKQGKSIGCKVGHLEENSLGLALGLQKGDIILAVNDIPATDTAQRFAIYKSIMNTSINGSIIARIIRNNQEMSITYTLTEPFIPSKGSSTESTMQLLEREQLKIMEEKYKLAPTIQEIRNKEKEMMRQKGMRPHGTH